MPGAQKVIDVKLANAQTAIEELEKWLTLTKKAIKVYRDSLEKSSETIQPCWAHEIMERALAIHSLLAQCHGAALVRVLELAEDLVTCASHGNACNICGGRFPEGGIICSLGHHELGREYPRPY